VTASDKDGILVNSPLITIPNDQMRLNRNLVVGRIDTTVDIYNLRTGESHELEIHVDTLANPSADHYYDSATGEYFRVAEVRSGYLLLDGELWYDLRHPGDTELLAWNFSTRKPPSWNDHPDHPING